MIMLSEGTLPGDSSKSIGEGVLLGGREFLLVFLRRAALGLQDGEGSGVTKSGGGLPGAEPVSKKIPPFSVQRRSS